MTTIREHWVFVVATTLWLLVLAVVFARAAEPTQAQINACTPDVMRLCPAEVTAAISGNRQPVTECIRHNFKLVSKQCRDAWK